MSKERYNQIIDEVFKKYGDSHWTPPENPNGPLLLDQLWSLKPMKHSKEGFINECSHTCIEGQVGVKCPFDIVVENLIIDENE